MNTTAPPAESGSQAIEDLAERHPSLVSTARTGWVAKGVVYILLGVIAVPIALQGAGGDSGGSGGGEASQTGAVARVAESPFGRPLLWIVAVGLALYALWRLVSILLPAENSAKAWLTRAGYGVSALVYLALAWTAVSFARRVGGSSGQGQSEDSRVEKVTRDVMEWSGGRWLVGLVGIGIVLIGVFFVIRGIRASFRKELEPGGVGPVRHETIISLGRVGWVGRGLMMMVVGWFVTRAAVRFRPEEAKGIDGALREVTGSTAGSVIVGFVAVTLILYGVFCVISAPRQRLVGAD
jgi:hypothetical protein